MSYRNRIASLPLAAILALALGACQNDSPTEPARLEAATSAASATDAATQPADGSAAVELPDGRRGAAAERLQGDGTPAPAGEGEPAADDADPLALATDGARGGKGKGGGGGKGGGRGNPRTGDIRLEIQPAVWNTNWERATGTVSALLRGADAKLIDEASIVLVGDAGEAQPRRVQGSGGQVRAFFAMADAIEVLDDPDRGETHTVRVQFTVDGGEAQELSFEVRVVGPAGGGDDGEGDGEAEVDAVVQPSTWNTNWVHASGTVSVVLRGEVANVDLDSIVLDGGAAEVAAANARRSGNHVRARFPMAEAFESLDDPDPGETHEITIRFAVGEGADATEQEITLRVRIVGRSS